MQAIRSLVFNFLFYVVLLVCMVLGLPALIGGRKAVLVLERIWARISMWLFSHVCGVRYEFRGLENIPEGGCIVASKHQSFWETFVLPIFIRNFTFILKRELTWLPFFGWYLKRAEMIGIDRSSGRSALKQVIAQSRIVLAAGQQLIIFPEGTRRPPGSEPSYKYGVSHIYTSNNVPCLPVALTSGLHWPRRSFLRYPGTLVVEFLEPIQPGMEADAFFALLQERMETATNRLIEEEFARNPQLRQAFQDRRSAANAAK